MADTDISTGLGGTVTVGMRTMDDGSSVQEFLIVRSDTTNTTYVTADADGILTNLGTNNDVTVTSGTVTIGGTPTVTVGGTATVDLGANNDVSLNAGTSRVGYVGISSDGTAIADMLSLTNGTAVAVGLYDSEGDQVTFAEPGVITFAPTMGTAASTNLHSLHSTVITLAGAAVSQNGTGSIIGAGLWDKDDQGQDIRLWLFSRSVTGTTAQQALSVADGDMAYCVGFIDFTNWGDGAVSQFATPDRAKLPLPYHCTNDGTSLYGILQHIDSGTASYSTAGVGGFIHVVAD